MFIYTVCLCLHAVLTTRNRWQGKVGCFTASRTYKNIQDIQPPTLNVYDLSFSMPSYSFQCTRTYTITIFRPRSHGNVTDLTLSNFSQHSHPNTPPHSSSHPHNLSNNSHTFNTQPTHSNNTNHYSWASLVKFHRYMSSR